MAGPEIIGLLCAGSTNYHPLGGGGRATQLTKSEMAGLLRGLSDEAMAFALAKYAVDLDAERRLIALVRVCVSSWSVREQWQIVRGRPTLSNMAAVAVFEVVRPNRCSRCRGIGFIGNKVCGTCLGTCYKPLSGRQVAEAMCIDHTNYIRTWKARYDRVLEHVGGLDGMVCLALRVASRRDDLAVV